MSRVALVVLAAVLGCTALGVRADEGMWTFDNVPRALIKQKYGFEITDQWLEHVRLASARVGDGGSGSFVSPDGLLFTNQHIGRDAVSKLSTPERDYIRDGFYAPTRAQELKCPDLEVNVLVSYEEVTRRVHGAVKPGASDSAPTRDSGLREIAHLTELAEVVPGFNDVTQALSAAGAGTAATGAGVVKRLDVTEETSPGVKRGNVVYWAKPVEKLRVTKVSGAVSSLNVEGRHPVGPVRGFGKMWEKTYELRFSDAKKTPFEIAATTKENFIRFQPPQNSFYPSSAGIAAGETVLIRSAVMGVPILTGVLVSYADDVSFTFIIQNSPAIFSFFRFYRKEHTGQVGCRSMLEVDPLNPYDSSSAEFPATRVRSPSISAVTSWMMMCRFVLRTTIRGASATTSRVRL